MAYQNLVQAQRGQSIAIEPIVLHLQKKKKKTQIIRNYKLREREREREKWKECLWRWNDEKVEMASDGEKEVVPETVSGFPIGSLTAKGLEPGPTHNFIFPILHFLSYEFPHFHSLSLSLLSLLLFRLFLQRQTRRRSYTKRRRCSSDTSTLFCHTHLQVIGLCTFYFSFQNNQKGSNAI